MHADYGQDPFMDEIQSLILEETRDIKRKLDSHIKEEGLEFKSMRHEIAELRRELALTKQRLGLFSAGVATVMTAIVSVFTHWFRG